MRFEKKAESYHRNALPQTTLANWLAEWLPARVDGKLSVVDMGAGTGILTRHLIPLGTIEAIDSSPSMLEAGHHHFPQARWTLGDAWTASGSWDLICSSSLLQWAPDPVAVLSHWRKSLRTHGRMIHGFFVEPSLPELAHLAGDIFPLSWHSPQTWIGAFEQAGFHVIRQDRLTETIPFGSARAFLRHLHDTGTTHEDPQMSPVQLRRILQAYDEQFALPAGGVRSTWTLMRIEAAHF